MSIFDKFFGKSRAATGIRCIRPDDDLLWRIEWIGGVGYNTSVPSDPQIEICLAQLPAGETNPLSARSLPLKEREQ